MRTAIERALTTAAGQLNPTASAGRVSLKADGSPVTDLDQQLDEAITQILRLGDEVPVLSEERAESHHQINTDLPCWVIDPIDGTKNLASGLPIVAVSIAHVSRRSVSAAGIWSSLWDAPMYSWRLADQAPQPDGPVAPWIVGMDLDHTDPRFRRASISVAEEVSSRIGAIRVLGSTATALAGVAQGSLDAYLKLESPIWDYAGGIGLVEASGGRFRSALLGDYSPYLLAGRRGFDGRLWADLTKVASDALATLVNGDIS